MAKIVTDINQSMKLAEILPLESADMVYVHTVDLEGDEHYDIDFRNNQPLFEDDISAWSLAALLSVLPVLGNKHAVFGTSIKESKWHILYHNIDTLFLEDSGLYDNLVDACYELILKLNELKML